MSGQQKWLQLRICLDVQEPNVVHSASLFSKNGKLAIGPHAGSSVPRWTMDTRWDEAFSDEGRLRVARKSFGLDAGRLLGVTCFVGVWEHTVGERMTSPTLAVCSPTRGKRNMPAHRNHSKQSTTKVFVM